MADDKVKPRKTIEPFKRSQYIADALEKVRAEGGPILSKGQLAANLLAQGLTGWGARRDAKAQQAQDAQAKADMIANIYKIGGTDKDVAMVQAGGIDPWVKSQYDAQADDRRANEPKYGVSDGVGYGVGPKGLNIFGTLPPTKPIVAPPGSNILAPDPWQPPTPQGPQMAPQGPPPSPQGIPPAPPPMPPQAQPMGAQPMPMPQGPPPGQQAMMQPPQGPPIPQPGGPPQSPSGGPDPNSLFGGVIQQESGGRPGVTGPQTPYGRAQGMTQMLPQTAQAMAQKLGVPWRPELMTGTSPEAAAYQEQLGRAYFDEGMQRYNGDPHKALMYYHGGPNEALWGPKTHQYAADVMSRVQPYQVASNGPTPPPPSQQQAQPQQQQSIPGYHVLQMGQPKQPTPPTGYRWTADGSRVEPIPGGPMDFDSGSTSISGGVTGPELLKTLPPSEAAIVQALAEGRMDWPKGAALRAPTWQHRIDLVAQYDPNFDQGMVSQNTRSKTRGYFTSGAGAYNITAINTAINHAARLAKAADDLQNTGIPWVNYAKNWIGANTGDQRTQGALADFNVAKIGLSNELAKAFRGASGNETDIQDWQKELDAAGSPTTLHHAITKALDLLNGRLNALGEQYNNGMGTKRDPLELLSPQNAKLFQQLDPQSGYGSVGGAAPGAGPAPPAMNNDPLGIRRRH